MKPDAQLSDLSPEKISCPMCGHRFNPAEHLACQSCPLQKGCQMVCCPNCGYETIDVNGSKLASWVSGLFSKRPSDSPQSTGSAQSFTKGS